MRLVGNVSNASHASRFADYLLTLEITARVDAEGNAFSIWVRDEQSIDRARELYAEFQLSPEADRYVQAATDARIIRRDEEKRQRQIEKKTIDVRRTWNQPPPNRCPITLSLIIICVVVYLLPRNSTVFQLLLPPQSIQHLFATKGFWRLITPIFLHGDIWHLIFNLLWLYILGQIIELRRGPWRYFTLVLLIALVSNFLQFAFSGPSIGISGVVCGIFGYVWIKSLFDPQLGMYISSFMAIIFIVSLFIWRPEVAHVAHFGGLFTGILIASLPIFVNPKLSL